MSNTDTDRPTWQRRRTKKRREERAERTAAHHKQLRREGAARGQRGIAEAEWNILRATVTGLPERVRDDEWKTVAALLRQISQSLSERHAR